MRCILAVVALIFLAQISPAGETQNSDLTLAESHEGFVSLFDGKSLKGWQGDVKRYTIEDGTLVCRGGALYTAKEYANFIVRFEFKLPPGGNNGVGIRTPMGRDPAYAGMEIQILDDGHPKYKTLAPYQAHGSIYGVAPAKRGFLKPPGEWNHEEIMADRSRIKVTLNGTVITDVDLNTISKTIDGREHPGLHNAKGYLGWLGHGDPVAFRNIRIKVLP